MKDEFYPFKSKDVLFDEGYIAKKSGHSRGSTMDLTIVELPAKNQPEYTPGQKLYPCTAPTTIRWPDNSKDFGTGFDCFDELANTKNSSITAEQAKNREFLVSAMEKWNFNNYWAE